MSPLPPTGTAFGLTINGVDKTPPGGSVEEGVEWNATWEERIDGVGVASFTIQDRNATGAEYGRVRDEIEMFVGADRVFHGEITRAELDLGVGRFPRWKVTASDFNTILDLRLVGCPDGTNFNSIDGGATHKPIDPHAHCRSTDRLTVEWLFEKYAKMPDGTSIDASTFVRHYTNRYILLNKNGNPVIWWTHVTLRQALDELASMAGFPIFFWMDPNDAFHWVNFRDFQAGLGALPRLRPKSPEDFGAPAIVTDVTADLNGVDVIGGRELSIEEDATFMPQQVYIVGITDYIRSGGGAVTAQGTGFRSEEPQDISKRQVLVDAQALTAAQRNATASAYLRYNQRGRIKGSITVGTPSQAVDGWHCGQSVTLIDERLPWNGKSFPIHRVSGSLKAGNDFREYVLEFGDAPIGRFGQAHKSAPQRLPVRKRIPASEHKITWPTTHLRPNTEYILKSQMVDTSGSAVGQAGVDVEWSMVVQDRVGSVINTGSLVPLNQLYTAVGSGGGITSTVGVFAIANRNETDPHGRASARLTTGASTDLFYQVQARTVAQHAAPEGPST